MVSLSVLSGPTSHELTCSHCLHPDGKDVDRVLLLQNGVVVEFDAPRKLLADKDSAFRELCAQSNELEELIRLAGID